MIINLIKIKAIAIAIMQFIVISYLNGAVTNRVAIVVNSYLKDEIEDNLNIYLDDLMNEGYKPVLKVWDLENDPSPQALKEYLKGLYLEKGGLQGAVFIGDLPIPIMKANTILKNAKGGKRHIHISNGYIAEKYYMDLVGNEWTSTNGDYKLDDPHYESYWDILWNTKVQPETIMRMVKNGDLYPTPEIWTSRIVTSTLRSLLKKSEGYLINAYLEKNHAYRTGDVVFQKQNLLYSLPKAMQNDESFDESKFNRARLILSRNYKIKEPKPAPEKIYDFFQPLKNGSYEILYWGRHGNKTSIDLGAEEMSSSSLLSNSYVSTAFVFPSSCLIGHYTEPRYFAGSYLFNNQYYALGMATATLPTYSETTSEIMDKFESGINLGQALKKSIEIPEIGTSPSDLKYLASYIASMNSRYILGDGTLKLQSNKWVANENNSPKKYINVTKFGSKAEQKRVHEETEEIARKKADKEAEIAKKVAFIKAQQEAAEIALKTAEIARTSKAAQKLASQARTAENLAKKIASQVSGNKEVKKAVQKANVAVCLIEEIVKKLKAVEATSHKKRS
jgi:hypothetical protein